MVQMTFTGSIDINQWYGILGTYSFMHTKWLNKKSDTHQVNRVEINSRSFLENIPLDIEVEPQKGTNSNKKLKSKNGEKNGDQTEFQRNQKIVSRINNPENKIASQKNSIRLFFPFSHGMWSVDEVELSKNVAQTIKMANALTWNALRRLLLRRKKPKGSKPWPKTTKKESAGFFPFSIEFETF